MVKKTDNTHITKIDRFMYPAVSTMIDRYVLASHWTKEKTVLDAATGYGYGAGILQSLGSTSVIGIDLDKDAITNSNKRFESDKCKFEVCDIFDLSSKFNKDQFEVCVSIETFEHLPPDRIDQYLQSISSVTSETLVITTPKRKTPTWTYNGGTHLYEYDPKEFTEILFRNFKDCDITGFGIIEVPLQTFNMPGIDKQWGSTLTADLSQSWIMVGVIQK
jgi:SAM-dependent methyltransferase